MPGFPLISEADFGRVRHDRAFRQQVLASQLQALITFMARLQATPEAADPALAAQLREGADLAVKLADILKHLAAEAGEPPKAA